MGLKRITLVWIVTFLLLSACSRGEATPTEELPAYDISVTKPAATPSALPTATLPPTATIEPTPIIPSIEVDTPSLTENGRLTISDVVIPDAGWLVITHGVGPMRQCYHPLRELVEGPLSDQVELHVRRVEGVDPQPPLPKQGRDRGERLVSRQVPHDWDNPPPEVETSHGPIGGF